jgi:hypothetical protein
VKALLALALLACAGAAAAEDGVPARLAPWLDPRADRVLHRAAVPSAERKLGEVRILARGRATVVQTLLYSKLLSRAVAEIRRKELANWPGDPDALRYVEALERAQQTIFRRLPAGPQADRRQKLWIEFVLAPDAAGVALGDFELEAPGGELRVVRRAALAVLEPSRSYVERNQRLIVADAYRVEGAEAERLLRSAGE